MESFEIDLPIKVDDPEIINKELRNLLKKLEKIDQELDSNLNSEEISIILEKFEDKMAQLLQNSDTNDLDSDTLQLNKGHNNSNQNLIQQLKRDYAKLELEFSRTSGPILLSDLNKRFLKLKSDYIRLIGEEPSISNVNEYLNQYNNTTWVEKFCKIF